MNEKSHIQYVNFYREYKAKIEAESCETMNKYRSESAAFLSEYGFPNEKTERYKYTNVSENFAPNYGINLNRLHSNVNVFSVYKCNVPNLNTSLFFVINDIPYKNTHSSQTLLSEEGIIVCSLLEAATLCPQILDKYYNHAAAQERGFKEKHDGFTMLNTMLAQDGLLIYIPKDVKIKNPIQIVNITDSKTPIMNIRRIIVVADKGAEGSILLCDHAESKEKSITSQVVEVYVEENAHLDIYSIEETREENTLYSTIYVEQAAKSFFSYDGITLTCGNSRNRLDVRLHGEEAKTELYGAVIADKKQHIDNNILVEHLAPKCTSDMLYKYVLNDSSVGAFAGKVYVAPNAQQTVSQQTNANLCASQNARAFSQPMLEIYADDVKCNHGSTVGKLDESALFYMRQRGIPEDEARLLLQHAFINEILRHVRIEPLQERISHLVELRFRGELKKCQGCKGCKY